MVNDIYNDISRRTDGDIYIGVVGPVQNGKIYIIKKIYGIVGDSEY